MVKTDYALIWKNRKDPIMNIAKTKQGNTLTVSLSGRLDTNTAPVLQEDVKNDLQDIDGLDLDLAQLEYISSAGLRVILFMNKQCIKEGAQFRVLHCNEVIKEVFQLTGFDGILDIQ